MMLEPASQVDESNYARLGNQLVGESYASRMARVRRQAGTSEPTLMAGSGVGSASSWNSGSDWSVVNSYGDRPQNDPIARKTGSTYDFSSGKQIVGPIYGLMAGAAAGALVGIIGNALMVKSGKSAMAAIVAGSTVALAAPKAYGAAYQAEMGTFGRIITATAMALGAGGILISMNDGRFGEIKMKELTSRGNIGKTLGWAAAGVLGASMLGWQTLAAEKGSFVNAMFTAAPLGLAAGIVGGFAHGAVRQSELSRVVDSSLDLPERISSALGIGELADLDFTAGWA